MSASARPRESTRTVRRALDPLDGALLASLVGLGGVSVTLILLPGLPERVVAPSLDLALDSVALVVTSLVATLSWIRFREARNPFALYQATAFLVLAITYLRAVIDTVGVDPTAPLSSAEPGHEQLYVFIAGRLVAATLLVIGGVLALRGRQEHHPARVIGLAIAAAIAIAVLAYPASGVLPALLMDAATDTPGAAITSLGSALHLIGSALFVGAVVVYRRLWLRDRSVADAFVTVGLLFAAFAMAIGASTAGSHPGPVTIADALWLAFDVTLLLAIEAEARVILRALRQANATLEELRAVEVSKAALEERARLSRELHDGLTQDLWLAKLKIGRLSAALGKDPEAHALVSDASDAIDQGLAEAHQAVMAMRIAAAEDGSFGQLLARYTEDFQDRFGQRVRVECDPDLPELPVRTQAELLRIAQEALANVHRHADARIARIRARVEDGWFVLVVQDDGRGFEVAEPGQSDFGLLAMRERAAMIGGELLIESRPGGGTRVEIRAPVLPATGHPLQPLPVSSKEAPMAGSVPLEASR
jgi:signal transduction histidine kinase